MKFHRTSNGGIERSICMNSNRPYVKSIGVGDTLHTHNHTRQLHLTYLSFLRWLLYYTTTTLTHSSSNHPRTYQTPGLRRWLYPGLAGIQHKQICQKKKSHNTHPRIQKTGTVVLETTKKIVEENQTNQGGFSYTSCTGKLYCGSREGDNNKSGK